VGTENGADAFFVCSVLRESDCVAQAGIELRILLPHPPECLARRCEAACLTKEAEL
jgi:hypothetical protein